MVNINSNPSSSEYLKRLNAALALREIPDHLAAQSQLTRAAELAPNDASIFLLLGLTYQDLNEMEKAESNFQKAVELQPELEEAQRALGLTLISNEKYGDAIPILKPIVEFDPTDLDVLQALAKAYEHESLVDDSFDLLKRSLLIDPANESISKQLFKLTMKSGDFDQAKATLDQVISVHITIDLLNLSGIINLLSEDFDGAISRFEDSIKIDEKSEYSWVNLIEIYIILKKYDEALNVVEIGLSKNPESIPILIKKARVLLFLGEMERCSELYEEIIESAKEKESTRLEFILEDYIYAVYRHNGPQSALDLLQVQITEFPQFYRLWKRKVALLIWIQMYSEAVLALEQISEIFPMKKVLVDYSYEAFHGAGFPEKAMEILNNEYQRFQDDERIKNSVLTSVESIGVRFFQRGLIEESRRIYEQVLSLDSRRPRSINNLAFIHISNQKWNDALGLLTQAEVQGYAEGGILEANRGFIYINQRKLDDALSSFQATLKIVQDDDQALLHVTYPWIDGITNESADNYPSRNVLITTSAFANLATLHYLMGELDKAWEAAHQAVTLDPNESTGHRVKGCLHMLTNQYQEAKDEWDLALHSKISDREKEVVIGWITHLTTHLRDSDI